jgi:hypothetical protein
MWTWLRDLFGPPKIEQVARDVMGVLQRAGASSLTHDSGMNEVRGELNGAKFALFLGNLYHEYRQAPRSGRAAVLDKYVDIQVQASNTPPESYEQARAQLMPIVRTRADEAMGMLSMQRFADPGEDLDDKRLATRALVGDFVIGLAYDTPNAMQRINQHQLAGWNVGFDQALDDALQNLRALPEHGGWVRLGDSAWQGSWGDNYESSRILLPDLIHRLGVSEPVALMPLRYTLLVCSARDEKGLALLAERARELMESEPRWLSLTPLKLGTQGWELFTPPTSCAKAYADLALLDESQSYAGQKSLLDDLNQRQGADVFVASATVVEKDGLLRSYSTWTEGVDTLLPRTELLVFIKLHEGQLEQSLMLAWDVAADLASHLMEATDFSPVRYRVRSFPDAALWSRLQAAQVSL